MFVYESILNIVTNAGCFYFIQVCLKLRLNVFMKNVLCFFYKVLKNEDKNFNTKIIEIKFSTLTGIMFIYFHLLKYLYIK